MLSQNQRCSQDQKRTYARVALIMVGSLGLPTAGFAETAGGPGSNANVAITAAIAAIFGAVLSFVAATFNEFRRRANDRKIARLNVELQERLTGLKRDNDSELTRLSAELKARGEIQLAEFNKAAEEQLSAKAARRSYEYEARKRLYQACEPLLFQLSQRAGVAIGRIISLAREAREGNLQGPGSLLAGELNENTGRGYYFRSTLYQTLAPLCVTHLLQSQLTLRDISLDRWVRRQYILSDAAYRALTRDFRFASQSPVIVGYQETADNVDPCNLVPGHLKQGLYLGRLDNLIEKLSDRTSDPPKVISFGQFEDLLEKKETELTRRIAPFIEILANFHPRTHPIFWRILVAQYYVFRAIRLNIRESLDDGDDDQTLTRITLNSAEERDLWWKLKPDEQVLSPIEIGYEYLVRTFGRRPAGEHLIQVTERSVRPGRV